MQLFIAHAFSIQGFIKGCQPVLAIDSCHLRGPYKGALLSAIAYDVDDGMFPLALGVASSENYEDWYWFLEKLKGVLDGKEVVIISDRHQGILRSVFELFGIGNHAYCYRHVKENFSSFLNKQNIRGKKGKEDALLLLDSIAYARLEINYNEAFEKLVLFNDNLGKWVAENNPEHWAMSKFLKKRWDKMTSNIPESFNAWLRDEHHQTIYTLLLMHMDKLVAMLDTHMRGTQKWKRVVGLKTEEKLMSNIMRHIDISSDKSYDLTTADVGLVFGVPTSGRILQIASTPSEHPFSTLNTCEERLLNLPVGEEFRRCFLYYACATILAPTSRIDGCRNLWHTIHEDGFQNDVNWGQFVVDQLVEVTNPHMFISIVQLHYVIKFKIILVHVPMTVPLLLAWSDELIKECLAAEINHLGSFGHGEGFDNLSPPRTHVESESGPTSSHELLEKYYAAERAINQYQKGIQHQFGIMRGLMHTLDGRKERSRPSPAGSHSSYAAHEFPEPEPHSDYGGDDMASHGTEDVPDTPIRHPSVIADEEVVVLEQLPLRSMVVAPSDRSGRRRIVVDAYCRMLQFDDKFPYPLKLKLFSYHMQEMVMCSNAKHLTHDAVIGRFEPYLYPLDVSYHNVNEVYLSVLLKNHWTLYVYDLHNKRIQLLDSRPRRKRSCMSGIQQNLAKVVLWLVAYKKQMVDVDLNMFRFVMLDGKIKKYRLKILGRLLLSSHNAHRHRFLVD
ncbi:hypothetical protein CK203_088780 [Vitis vinifera]|uniref:MULE transposase domain-containing protein n=1 Tax=Vitis vinifera TaxID=29760 RepID=A0A438BRL2_VITVI|nr:hypothetical protein CK203_088780 [Vitis vinifera]